MGIKLFLHKMFVLIFILDSLTSCFQNSEERNNHSSSVTYEDRNYESSLYSNLDNDESTYDNYEYYSNSNCKFEDGTFSATVDYYNPATDYSQTYTLDVEVEDCEIVKIYFPKGGWLDSDHITPSELSKDGTSFIYGEEGKTYEIQIDN